MNSRSRGLLTHLIQKFKRAVLIDIWQSSSLILLLCSLLTLLLNHETYFNQTKHNWGWLFSGVNHIKIVKWHLRFLKIIFSRISCQISSKFVIAQPLMSGIQIYYLNHYGFLPSEKLWKYIDFFFSCTTANYNLYKSSFSKWYTNLNTWRNVTLRKVKGYIFSLFLN